MSTKQETLSFLFGTIILVCLVSCLIHPNDLSLNMRREKLFCDYKECQSSFKDKYDFQNHITSLHGGKRFACCKCNSGFKDKSDLKKHTDSIHEGKRYPCDKCEYKATLKSNLKIHRSSIHDGKRHLCVDCGYNATHQSTLLRHRKLYHMGREYRCTDCPFIATRKIDLRRHKEKTHRLKTLKGHNGIEQKDNLLECEKCTVIAGFTGEKTQCMCVDSTVVESIELFKCYYCDFTSNKNTLIKHHMDKEHTNTPSIKNKATSLSYPCQDCNYEATQNCHLKRHWMANHGLTKFNCDFCDKCFRLEESLKQHIKRMHKN